MFSLESIPYKIFPSNDFIKSELLKFETDNSQCSMNISQLGIEEIDQLAKFIEDAKKQVQKNGKEIE